MLNISPAPVSSAGLTFGTITRVQSISGNTGSSTVATSITLTFGANLTVGNLLVVAMSSNIANCAKILDPGGTQSGFTALPLTSNTAISIGFLMVETAGTSVVLSLTTGSAFLGGAVGVEYSGAKLRPEGMAIGNNSNSASPSTATLTTGQSNELVIAAFVRTGAQTSEQTGWLTAISNSFSSVLQTSSFANTANDRTCALCERIVSAPGSYSTSGTQTSAAWATNIVSFVSD